MIVLSGFLKERITILLQKYETRVPDCHRCSKAVTNLIPTAGEKIIQIKNYRNLKISPILKAPKVAQRTKVVLISQNYTLGLNVPRLCAVLMAYSRCWSFVHFIFQRLLASHNLLFSTYPHEKKHQALLQIFLFL